MIKEFKEFAFKGNVLDMAVGVVIGTAFGKIVTSVVNDLIMPICAMLLNGIKFTDLKISLQEENAIMIGNFIQAFVDFLIIAASVFIFVKLINSFKRKKPAEEPAPEEPKAPTSEELLAEIRDLLKKEACTEDASEE
ncbi:MAG: large-conductance mechanosensitive channel protein MscL [Clostridia bacterium]|nr:large-conductance mechanosensitive channel protein MscL [Clostridia bacterium]